MVGRARIWLVAAIALAGLWVACDKSSPEPEAPAYPYAYYPLDTGLYRIYQVDSIIYNETFANDTTSWQVMEVLTDTFYDLEGHLNYTIERSRRSDATQPWEIINVWQVGAIDGRIEKAENNLRFIKLTTPLKQEKPGMGMPISVDWMIYRTIMNVIV